MRVMIINNDVNNNDEKIWRNGLDGIIITIIIIILGKDVTNSQQKAGWCVAVPSISVH